MKIHGSSSDRISAASEFCGSTSTALQDKQDGCDSAADIVCDTVLLGTPATALDDVPPFILR